MSILRTVAAALAVAALVFPGCAEPLTMYQVPEANGYYASGRKILVMPFMDTRTFVPDSDPHTPDLGNHARTIFVAAMREHESDAGAEILTPAIPQPARSMTNAEVAEIGRRHGADVVVAGQVFSFTDTRAASIPPRAGMFVRVISARDGALLFTGDHYQAAMRPMAGGGRDLQARNVSNRLVEGFFAAARPVIDAAVAAVASHGALAMLGPVPAHYPLAPDLPFANPAGGESAGADAVVPEPPPFPSLGGGSDALLDPGKWDEQLAPAVPPLLDIDDDFYHYPAPAAGNVAADDGMPTPLPPPPLDELGAVNVDAADLPAAAPQAEEQPAAPEKPGDKAVAVAAPAPIPAPAPAPAEEEQAEPAGAAPAVVADAAAQPLDTIDELPELELSRVDPNMISVDEAYPPLMEAAKLTGNELAMDLFESDGDVWDVSAAPVPAAPGVRPDEFAAPFMSAPIVVPEARDGARIPSSETAAAMVSRAALAPTATDELRPFSFDNPPGRIVAPLVLDAGDGMANGPIVSMPMAVEQPRTIRSVDMELAADPAAAMQTDAAQIVFPARSTGSVRVLILPYHDRPNPNNLIPQTGGGEVVTTLYGTHLSLDPQIQIMWDASGLATHQHLISREDAVEMGRLADADYVVRGQVVEFRRAQSVPSFYSAVISTAVLAAQVFFAEMSGVDVATEVYRVRDGLCVMSRRDRAQQKYVVQAEKTVRRMAAGMADSVSRVVREAEPEEMDPLIDELSPVTVLTNPK